MTPTITELMKANLHTVFGERDREARLRAVRDLYSDQITNQGRITTLHTVITSA